MRNAGLITRSGFFRSAPGSFIGIFDFVTNNVLGVAETVAGAGDCLAYMATSPHIRWSHRAVLQQRHCGHPGVRTKPQVHRAAAVGGGAEGRGGEAVVGAERQARAARRMRAMLVMRKLQAAGCSRTEGDPV